VTGKSPDYTELHTVWQTVFGTRNIGEFWQDFDLQAGDWK
jgi:hypothetical protein